MRSQHCLLSLGLVLSLLSQGDAACSMTSPCLEELGQGKPFVEPDQFKYSMTSGGIEINVDVHEVQYGWLKMKRRMYNGKIVGPTWNVKRGDKVAVTVNNRLSAEGNDNGIGSHNRMNYPNTTNLHTHGLHISSNSPQDNVLIRIEPGEKYEYKFEIHEENPHGTYWYHAHIHQATMFQVQSGLSGLIIVEDEVSLMPPELEAVSCPNNCDKDLQMIIQPILQYSNSYNGFALMQDEIGDSPFFRLDKIITDKNYLPLSQWVSRNLDKMTVNGLLEPVLNMVAGQVYRYRMVNAGGDSTIEAFITEKGTNTPASSCDIREIAVDGVYLNAPRPLHVGQSYLGPATRIDWLVRCNTPGKYELRSYRKPESELSIGLIHAFNGVLLTISVTLDALNPVKSFPTTLPPRPHFVGDLRKVDESDIKGRFVVEFNTGLQLNREIWHQITDYRYKMRVNEVQEWHVLNTDNTEAHPLHNHVNHFQVISYNKYTGGFSIRPEEEYVLYSQEDKKPCHYQRAGLEHIKAETVPDGALRYLGHEERFKGNKGDTAGYSRLGDWRETLMVPPLANITIRFIPDRFIGNSIVHCHVLSHEDNGMMMNTLIVGKDESVDGAVIKSGNAYPGTCGACDRYPFNNPKTLCEGNPGG